MALVDRLAAFGPVPGVDEPPRHRFGILVDVDFQAPRHSDPLVRRTSARKSAESCATDTNV
jgi:hypothetical protein